MMNKRNVLVLALVVLTVVTLGSVAGTYAKYTFAEDIADSARIAKWHISNDDDYNTGIFLADYGDVKSMDGAKVMAPGTQGEYSFQLTGEVETDYTLALDFTSVSDTINNAVKAKGGEDYAPIVYTFYSGTDAASKFDTKLCESTDINEFTACVSEKVSGTTGGKPTVFKAGNVSTPIYTFKWVWEFEQGEDAADTELANLMYEALKSDATKDAYKVAFDVTVSATQYNEN